MKENQMSKPPWEQSVEHARLATIKTFEGRMEAAQASFEQIPKNGRGAEGHTLAEFAEQSGIAYGSIDKYRRVFIWLGEDFGQVAEIGSYSVAREALSAGRWATVRGFLQERDRTALPDGFKSWTLDAVRVGLLDIKPSNTGRMQRAAAAAGIEPGPDEVALASAVDQMESMTDNEVFDTAVAASKVLSEREKPAKKGRRRDSTPQVELMFAISRLKNLVIWFDDDEDEAVVDDQDRYLMQGLIQAGRGYLDAIEAYVEGRDSFSEADMQELHALLREAESTERK
jgi:hypothetical protein